MLPLGQTFLRLLLLLPLTAADRTVITTTQCTAPPTAFAVRLDAIYLYTVETTTTTGTLLLPELIQDIETTVDGTVAARLRTCDARGAPLYGLERTTTTPRHEMVPGGEWEGWMVCVCGCVGVWVPSTC